MKSESIMNSEESILLIQRMINTAKQDLEDKSFYYLLWGWLVFIACVVHYIFIQIQFSIEGLGWSILMPLGGIVTMIYSFQQDKKQRVQSYTNEIMKYVLISFLVSLFVVLFFMPKLGLATYPLILIIYGTWLFISGGALKFRPLVIGGIINWAFAVASFFVLFELQLIMLATAVLLGYIIPGHLLRNKYKKEKLKSERISV